MKIAILGWGSVIWDKRPGFAGFENQHGKWLSDGPNLCLEFSRVSRTRERALTLVIDNENGSECQVCYSLSKRKNPDDAICDLRCREGTTTDNIGCYSGKDSKPRNDDQTTVDIIAQWAQASSVDVVVWANLKSNFKQKSIYEEPFSVQQAIRHLNDLPLGGKLEAAEYVRRAPGFIDTPLRGALESKKSLDHDLTHEEIAVAAYFIRENQNRKQCFAEHGRAIGDWFAAKEQLEKRLVCAKQP